MNDLTTLLFARPTFFEGVGRVLDIGGTLVDFNRSSVPDVAALSSDWRAIGEDLKNAMDSANGQASGSK